MPSTGLLLRLQIAGSFTFRSHDSALMVRLGIALRSFFQYNLSNN